MILNYYSEFVQISKLITSIPKYEFVKIDNPKQIWDSQYLFNALKNVEKYYDRVIFESDKWYFEKVLVEFIQHVISNDNNEYADNLYLIIKYHNELAGTMFNQITHWYENWYSNKFYKKLSIHDDLRIGPTFSFDNVKTLIDLFDYWFIIIIISHINNFNFIDNYSLNKAIFEMVKSNKYIRTLFDYYQKS